MDEEIKKAISNPFKGVGWILGFITTIIAIITFIDGIALKILFIITLLFFISILVNLNLYSLSKDLTIENNKLLQNNKGLIETKDIYLEDKLNLKEELEKYSEENAKLFKNNDQLGKIVKNILIQMDFNDIKEEDLEFVIKEIIGGFADDKRERGRLEGNQDN